MQGGGLFAGATTVCMLDFDDRMVPITFFSGFFLKEVLS